MRDVDHTQPHTENAFTRGPAVAADGGDADRTNDTQTMADIDHDTADEGVDRAYERGTERRDETV
jgi:hypothetical protein